MEANICDINHLDADVLLPPRKRLLAGLKKQNGDGNPHLPSTSSASSEFDNRLNHFLRSHTSNPNISNEEIVEASRLAAEAAIKVAEAARAAAEEKAVIAAKAVAAAKSALELVATVSGEIQYEDRYSKKNKMKKHVQVQKLYNKKGSKTDEEVARNLHRAINSSPRISKNSSTSDLKSHKHKRLKMASPEKVRVPNGVLVRGRYPPSTSNGNGVVGAVASEGSTRHAFMVRVDENTSKYNKADRLKMDNGEPVSFHSKEKMEEALEDTCSLGRKRGRIKQKKLPLSICNIRDQTNPKEELKPRSLFTEESTSKATAGNNPFFSVGPSGDSVSAVERSSMWKCKAFKSPACVKQNKVMQS
ncbi:hypothetical protein RJ640_027791 [Escallonia rubra]|uniref:Uncharacterized protein n=1 Tax=Escallonia rubra TaxID=112253 RepID=A0AA88U9Q9_9ASTE|nr:hypothetical protein RJ640_027791 [Escallonia rubra]